MRAPVPLPSRSPGAVAGRLPPKVGQPRLPPNIPLTLEAPDPIDEGQYPTDPEGQAKTELNQVQAGFRERMKQEADRFKSATDVDYYFVVVCNSGDQAEALMKELGVDSSQAMVDGRLIARHLGIEIPPDPPPLPRITSKRDAKLSALVRMPNKPK